LYFCFSRYGGDTSLVNDNKKSVVDLAAKQDCPELLQIISKYHGQQMINQQEKKFYDDRAKTKFVNGHRLSDKQ